MAEQSIVAYDQGSKGDNGIGETLSAAFSPLYTYIKKLEGQPGRTGNMGEMLVTLFDSCEREAELRLEAGTLTS